MKIVELFSLSKGKSLQEFAWGLSFLAVINEYLPEKHRVRDSTVTGDFLYSALLQLPPNDMIGVINTTIEISGNEILVAGDEGEDNQIESRPRRTGHHRKDYMMARRNEPGYTSDPRGSKLPTIVLILAITLVFVCLGLAITQSVLSVKSGRKVGDDRTVTSIASIIGDVAKAFVNSGSSPYSSRPVYDPYEDRGYPDRRYEDPRERQRPIDPDEQLDQRYGPQDDPGATQEPVRPQSGSAEPPPYD